jgi:hypothetical protein
MIAILPLLSGVRKGGAGHVAKCPAHDDQNASLSISAGDDGRTLLKCHAGCDFTAICAAIQVNPSDLFADKNGHQQPRSEIVATYDYKDESDALLFQVVRFMPKDFRQRRPDASAVDGWNWSTKGIRRVLYRLPDVMAAIQNGETIFIAEGEKDVHALVKHGLHATCNQGGAGKWEDGYSETLRGANVVIIPDNDAAGAKHAELVASKLRGTAASVKTVALPIGKDAFEFFEKGGTVEQLVALPDVNDVLPLRVAERLFNPALRPPALRPVYSMGEAAICTRGNLAALTAHAKAGKSGLVNALLAAPMAIRGSDTFGIASENPEGFAVVHIDTEQAKEDHWHQVHRAMRRAGRETVPPWLLSFCFTGFSAKQARADAWLAVEHAAKQFGGIHSVHLDGAADLVADVNDAEECNEFVASLHALAIRFDCPITCVIHFNPGSEKTRGHLGSQLERKAETNLRIDKDGEVSEVWSEKQRRAPIVKGKGPRFQWSDESGMHVSVAAGASAKETMALIDAKNLRDEVFDNRKSARYSELVELVTKATGKSERSAKRILDSWQKLGVTEKSFGGLWIPKT